MADQPPWMDYQQADPTGPWADYAAPADMAPIDTAPPEDNLAPAGSGFTDEQMQAIRDFLPKAKDAADLERFSLELTAGKAKIGNAQEIIDKMKNGATPDAFAFAPPTVDKSMGQPDKQSFRDKIGEGIIDAIDSFVPGTGDLLRAHRGSAKAYIEHTANALAADYGPEVGGVIDKVLDPSSDLKNNIAHERAILSGDSEDHGLASAAGELTGVGLGAATLPATDLGLVGNLARASAEGAVYGSGAAGPDDRAMGAAEGAIAAPVLGAAIKAPMAAYDAAKTVFQDNPNLALRIVSKAIKADQNTPTDVASALSEANANGVPMAIADTGENARGLLAASSRSSGVARTIARDSLTERQSQLADRVTGAIERDLGPIANPHEVANTLMTRARDTAAPLYGAAYSRPGADAFAQKVEPLLERPSMQKALGNAYHIAAEEGRDPETLGFDLDPEGNVTLAKVPSWQTLDYVKRGMDDVVESYRDPTSGKLNLDTRGRAVNNTLRSFLSAFDKANPDYAAARAAYGGDVSGINAMNLGRKALNMSADDLEARMRDMTPFQKEMFAAGARRAMAETVSSKGDSADVVNALVGTGKKRAMLARLFGDRQAFQRFVNTLGKEREGFRTFKTALLGSPTAPNLQDDATLNLAAHAADALLTGLSPLQAVRYAMKFGVGKIGEKTKQQVAALLSNTDPARFRELADQLRMEAERRGLLNRKVGIAARIGGNTAATQAQ